MKKLLLALLFTLIFVAVASAETFIESVVKGGIGARPLGMGGAFVAVADDSNAIFYNPGGLGSISFQYTRGYSDLQNANSILHDYYLLAFKAVGVGTWRRQALDGNLVNVDAVSIGSMGRNRVGWGFTTKTITGLVSGEVLNSWSLDVGLKMPIDAQTEFGLMLQDIMKKDLTVPVTIRAGIAYKLLVGGLVAVDAEVQNLRSEKGANIYMHYGIERSMTENLILRAGWGRDYYTGGATAAFKFFTADFAVNAHPSQGKPVYMMSFRLGE